MGTAWKILKSPSPYALRTHACRRPVNVAVRLRLVVCQASSLAHVEGSYNPSTSTLKDRRISLTGIVSGALALNASAFGQMSHVALGVCAGHRKLNHDNHNFQSLNYYAGVYRRWNKKLTGWLPVWSRLMPKMRLRLQNLRPRNRSAKPLARIELPEEIVQSPQEAG